MWNINGGWSLNDYKLDWKVEHQDFSWIAQQIKYKWEIFNFEWQIKNTEFLFSSSMKITEKINEQMTLFLSKKLSIDVSEIHLSEIEKLGNLDTFPINNTKIENLSSTQEKINSQLLDALDVNTSTKH